MDKLEHVVSDIVARCRNQGVEVSETLAAFTLQLQIQNTRRHVVLEPSMSSEHQFYLVEECENFLLRRDDPVLETIKMQLDFDLTYANLEEALEFQRDHKEHAITKLQQTIVSLIPEKATDFEALSTLYKHIFTMLMLDVDGIGNNKHFLDAPSEESPGDHQSKQRERQLIEKEVAAALESVFPRIGLKSFVTMAPEAKRSQLNELRHIVEGIRLFNKEIGKGGAGILISAKDIEENALTLSNLVQQEVRDTNESCTQYTEVLLYMHHQRARAEDDAEPLSPSSNADEIMRWQDELSNRRQFLSYLQSLEEDIKFSHERVTTRVQTFQNNLNALQSLVGARTSLPKSHVYPLFEAVSRSWVELNQEHELLQVRSRALQSLLRFKSTFTRTLSTDSLLMQQVRSKGAIPPPEDLFSHIDTFSADKQLTGERCGYDDEELNGSESDFDLSEENSSFPIRMPVESTPEIMRLPLEYHGFCPWTIVEQGGLLLPGDPSLGIVQYRNAYHVFINERALGEFMINPRRYIQGIKHCAACHPALIYLLRLQDSFPNLTLSSLLQICPRYGKDRVHPLFPSSSSHKVDASTATPTHFVDKYIDYNYDWNEWNLRRKAIKIANLRHCRTVGAQTPLSTFRHEVDTQVYLPTEVSCQTDKVQGTNPPRVITCMTGLRRGHVYTVDDVRQAEAKEKMPRSASKTRFEARNFHEDAKDEKETVADDYQAVILSYTFDL